MLARVKEFFNLNKPDLGRPEDKVQEFRKLLGKLDVDYSYTPDVSQLEKREYHPVFIYDGMMKGRHEHELLEGKFRVVDGYNPHPTVFTREGFELWVSKRHIRKYPIALKSTKPQAVFGDVGTTQVSSRIKGQLFHLTPETVIELDKHRFNGVLFHRERVDISYPFRHQFQTFKRDEVVANEESLEPLSLHKTTTTSQEYILNIKAFMYIGEPGYWEPHLDGGCNFEPANLLTPRPKVWITHPFYYYLNRES